MEAFVQLSDTASMRLKYIDRDDLEAPLICAYACDDSDLLRLRDSIRRLRVGELGAVEIHEIADEPDGGQVALTAMVGSQRVGIVRQRGAVRFQWILTDHDWETVEGLVDGLRGGPPGSYHQWLAGGEARYGLELSRIAFVATTSSNAEW